MPLPKSRPTDVARGRVPQPPTHRVERPLLPNRDIGSVIGSLDVMSSRPQGGELPVRVATPSRWSVPLCPADPGPGRRPVHRGEAPGGENGLVAVTTPPHPVPSTAESTPSGAAAVTARRWARPGLLAGAGLALAAVYVALLMVGSAPTASAVLHAPQAIILGAVEGITEFLPISSTGHLVVTERLLGLGGTKSSLEALDSYAVIIQGGAILAVAVLYWRRLWASLAALAASLHLPGFRRRPVDPADRRLAVGIIVAVAPAGLIGFVAGDAVQHRLFSPVPIALAWIAGGAHRRPGPGPGAVAGREPQPRHDRGRLPGGPDGVGGGGAELPRRVRAPPGGQRAGTRQARQRDHLGLRLAQPAARPGGGLRLRRGQHPLALADHLRPEPGRLRLVPPGRSRHGLRAARRRPHLTPRSGDPGAGSARSRPDRIPPPG